MKYLNEVLQEGKDTAYKDVDRFKVFMDKIILTYFNDLTKVIDHFHRLGFKMSLNQDQILFDDLIEELKDKSEKEIKNYFYNQLNKFTSNEAIDIDHAVYVNRSLGLEKWSIVIKNLSTHIDDLLYEFK